jgi:GNAT acetyltransferase-like protein
MRIQCIDNESGLVALKDDWEALRRSSAAPFYFLSHDWIRCCWEELKSSHALRVFVVRNEDCPILIAPCMLSHLSNKRFPATSLTFIEHPETQISDMLIRRDADAGRALNALLRYLLTEKANDWTLLLLDKISSDSQMARCLQSLVGEVGNCWQSEISHEVLVIPLNRTWQEYSSEQSPRFRKTLRNINNRIQKLGSVDVRVYQGKRATEAVDKLFSVSEASWKVADGVAITNSAKRMQFFKELSQGPLTADGLRIVVLELEGKPIASETQVIDDGIVYALRSDYDERYADSSPGTFLQMEILKELFASAYTEYNFGVGLNPYKARWTEERRQLMRFRLYNDTLYGRLLHKMNRCEPKFSKIPGVRFLKEMLAGNHKTIFHKPHQ